MRNLLLASVCLVSQIETAAAHSVTISPKQSLAFKAAKPSKLKPAVRTIAAVPKQAMAIPGLSPVSSPVSGPLSSPDSAPVPTSAPVSSITSSPIASPDSSTVSSQLGVPALAAPLPPPRPNISFESATANRDQSLDTIEHVMGAYSSMLGAPPRYTSKGRTNPLFDEFIGGERKYRGMFGPEIDNGSYENAISEYGVDPRMLGGHKCSKYDTDRLVCAVCNIYWEAAREPYEGQVAVGRSVLTRTFSRAYPDTVCGVIWQKSRSRKTGRMVAQYSWTLEEKEHNHVLPKGGKKLEQVIQAALESLKRGPNGLTNYYAYNLVNPGWGRGGSCAATSERLGRHQFCSINATATRTLAQVRAAEGLTSSPTILPIGMSDIIHKAMASR